MKNTKRFRLIIGLIAIMFLVFTLIRSCIIPFARDISEQNISKEEVKRKKEQGRDEAINLFVPEVRKKLILKHNFVSKSKHAYSVFVYDRKYKIVVHKINSMGKFSLEKIVDYKRAATDLSPDVVYAGYEDGNYLDFSYSSEYDSTAKSIYITYDYKSPSKIAIGDSIISYNTLASNISIRYEADGPNDMVFKTIQPNAFHPEPMEISMSVALYKKGSSVFIIVLYVRDRGIIMDDMFLPNLLGVR